MQTTLREIRVQLRLAMNGVVSTSMREKGLDYKLNFGVSFPQIKEIAATHTKDTALAAALWQENVRELKILATLLQPIESFTPEQAEAWALSIPNQEIAEQYCFNLLQELPFAFDLVEKWVNWEEEILSVLGFMLFARLAMKEVSFPTQKANEILQKAKQNTDSSSLRLQQVAILALKRYGRQTPNQASVVLSLINDYKTSDLAERREIYDDILFELEYYL